MLELTVRNIPKAAINVRSEHQSLLAYPAPEWVTSQQPKAMWSSVSTWFHYRYSLRIQPATRTQNKVCGGARVPSPTSTFGGASVIDSRM